MRANELPVDVVATSEPRWLLRTVILSDSKTLKSRTFLAGDRAGIEVPSEFVEQIGEHLWSGGVRMEWDGEAWVEVPLTVPRRPSPAAGHGQRQGLRIRVSGTPEIEEIFTEVRS